ncbi:MAG: histidine kinase [Bacteroidales bacterium]|nr:histidine kinase [Bacteroidales bacterium]
MKKVIILFSAIWAILTIAQIYFIRSLTFSSLSNSIIDAIVFNTIFAVVYFGLWQLTLIYDIAAKKFFHSIFKLFFANITLLIIWESLSYTILYSLFINDKPYIQFLNNTIIHRFIIGLLISFVVIYFFYLIRLIEYKNWQIQHNERISSQLKNAQIKALYAQINPHFLFNSLHSLQSLILTDTEKALLTIQHLSELLRYSLTKQDIFVSFHDELSQIQKYLFIEKIRFGHLLNININVDEEALSAKLPNMLLQPLIENAIKFGVYDATEKAEINLNAKLINNELRITLTNTYDSNFPIQKGTGLGLKNVKERLFTIYFRKDLLQIQSNNNIFIVELQIPQL